MAPGAAGASQPYRSSCPSAGVLFHAILSCAQGLLKAYVNKYRFSLSELSRLSVLDAQTLARLMSNCKGPRLRDRPPRSAFPVSKSGHPRKSHAAIFFHPVMPLIAANMTKVVATRHKMKH